MSFFDQPYYAITKAQMSRIGIWPEQSKYVRTILPLTMLVISLTFAGPVLIRLHAAWRDIRLLARSTTNLLMGIGILSIMFNIIKYMDIIKLLLKKMEKHWEMCKNTPAVIVHDKFAERGRYITVIYSSIYVAMTVYYVLCLSPVILDFVNPINDTRPKIYIVEAEYGVDADKYYWFITAHTFSVMTMLLSITIAIGSMYILLVVHTCALFEVVGYANSYANMIEEAGSGPCGMALGTIAMITVISGVQALINWNRPEMLIQEVILIIGQILHLYVISIPGQELMNHSGKIHTTAYILGWQDMSAKAQKLLILLMMRSNKPCYFTAGKVYVLSIETFGSALRIVISYFTIFAQMI